MARPLSSQDWEDRYITGDLPWDSGRPDTHLVKLISAGLVNGRRVLEVGCGTGTNAIWLAQRGFEVVGLDVAAAAIEIAQKKAADQDVDAHFATIDFMTEDTPDAPFELVLDRGCFHCFDLAEDRRSFAGRVASQLPEGGHWYSLIGSTDGPPRDHGPPRRSLGDIAQAVEDDFEMLEIKSSTFDSKLPTPARIFACLMRRR